MACPLLIELPGVPCNFRNFQGGISYLVCQILWMFILVFLVKGFSHRLLLWFHPTGADSYIVQSFFTGFTGIFYWNILSCMLKFMDVYTRVLGLGLFSSTTSLISPNWRWLIYILVFFWKFLSCCQHGEVWHLFVKYLNFCSKKLEMFQVLLGKSKMCWLPLFAGTFSDETDRILFVQWLLIFLLPRESK